MCHLMVHSVCFAQVGGLLNEFHFVRYCGKGGPCSLLYACDVGFTTRYDRGASCTGEYNIDCV